MYNFLIFLSLSLWCIDQNAHKESHLPNTHLPKYATRQVNSFHQSSMILYSSRQPSSITFDHLRNHSHLTTKIEASRETKLLHVQPLLRESPTRERACKSITWPSMRVNTRNTASRLEPRLTPWNLLVARWSSDADSSLKADESLGQGTSIESYAHVLNFNTLARGQTRRGWFQPSKLKVQGAASRPTTLEVTTTDFQVDQAACSRRWCTRAPFNTVSSRLPLHAELLSKVFAVSLWSTDGEVLCKQVKSR